MLVLSYVGSKILLLYENHEMPQQRNSCENIKYLACLIFIFLVADAFIGNNDLTSHVAF